MKLIELIDIKPHDTKWLNDLNSKGLLEIDNSFQRNYVWTAKHQVKLLESILIGYPIPEVYLWNVGTDENSGDTKYSIVDGQQRCGALFQFINNKFKLKELFLDPKLPVFDTIKNRYFKDLDASHKKAIWAYTFSIRIVRNQVPKQEIVDMFLRLNSNNMTLNPQELRNAEFEGEFISLAAEIAELEFWESNDLFTIADRRRMRDVSIISTLLVFIKSGIDEDINSSNLNQIYDLYNDYYPDRDKDLSNFKKVLTQIDTILNSDKERSKFLRRQVHFYSLFTATYENILKSNQLSDQQIKNYQTFVDNYENDVLLQQKFESITTDITIYKSLVKEGTRQKANRFDRHKIIKKILNYQ